MPALLPAQPFERLDQLGERQAHIDAAERALKWNQDDDGEHDGGGWWSMREVRAIEAARAALGEE
jgi:hypothetical protein